MTVRDLIAKNAALKAEAESMWASAAQGTGFTDEQKARYAAIKTELANTQELITASAEIASFNVVDPAVSGKHDEGNVRASKEYEAAYKQYVMSRGRMVPTILADNVETGDFASDGVLLPTTFDRAVVELANNDSVMRQLGTVIPTTVDVPFPVETARGDAAATAEAPSNGSLNLYHQDDPTFTVKKLSAHKITKVIPISEELFADYNAFQAYVTGNLGRSIAEFEEAWFINGAGTTEPEGVVTGATSGVTTDSVAIDFINDLGDLVAALKSSYLNGACFLMNRKTQAYLRKQTNGLGIPYWPYTEKTLMGYPVYLSDQMPDIAYAAKPILFGNFKQAVIIGDRGGLQTRILDQPKATQGMVDFIGKRRVDQVVVLPEAIKYLKVISV